MLTYLSVRYKGEEKKLIKKEKAREMGKVRLTYIHILTHTLCKNTEHKNKQKERRRIQREGPTQTLPLDVKVVGDRWEQGECWGETKVRAICLRW